MGLGDMFSKIFNKEEENEPKSDGESGVPPSLENTNEDESVHKDNLGSKEISKIEQKFEDVNASQKQVDDVKTKSADVQRDSTKDDTPSNTEQINKDKILEILSDVYDPEIPIDIVNLGLIYDIEVQDGHVYIKMTMTSPGCPASGEIVGESKMLIEELQGVKSATIDIVWDPPWDPSKMSEEAKQSMGM